MFGYGMYGMIDYDEPAPVVHRWRVIYFDVSDWSYCKDTTLLAHSEVQCREWADKQCPQESRMRDYPEGRKDSLQIIKLAEVTLPYELDH